MPKLRRGLRETVSNRMREQMQSGGLEAGFPEVVPGINIRQQISTVKFGINYRFGWGEAPVVAGY